MKAEITFLLTMRRAPEVSLTNGGQGLSVAMLRMYAATPVPAAVSTPISRSDLRGQTTKQMN